MADDRLQVVESPGAYVYFVLSAFAITLVGGPVVGLLLWASRSGVAFADREPAIIQAHGWTQLLGWAGLFVAGFSLRLLPRFAGRPEGSSGLSLVLLGALVGGALLRMVGEVVGGPVAALAPAGEVLAALGIGGVSARQVAVLRSNRSPAAPWALLAWIGAGWWGIWALLTLLGAVTTTGAGSVPFMLDRATVWTVTLGAVGNFIWAVQSRMMPVSFGRRPVTRGSIAGAVLAYNLGLAVALVVALLVASGRPAGGWPEARTAGLGLAGAGMTWMAFTCGVTHGRPSGLRPSSQPLARLIVWANRWAVVAGLLLVLLATRALLPRSVASLDLEDAALHAVEVGLITLLIAAMLQLVAPVFAMARIGPQPRERFVVMVWALLMTATLTRVSAALLPAVFGVLAGISGVTGWLAIGLLAMALVRAHRGQNTPRPAPQPRAVPPT